MNTSLIIGGSKGLGLEIANQFKKRGDRVIVLSRNKNSWEGEIIQSDLSDPSSLEKAIKFINSNKINFNYIVFSQKNRVSQNNLDIEIQISLRSTQYIIEKLIPDSMKDGGGVVFLGSPARKFIVREQPLEYHVGKSALEQLAKYYAVYFGKYGITFNSVLPGTILKESNREFYDKNYEIVDLLKRITPLKKLGDAKDIANVVSFFFSKNAGFVTGQNILVDGGRSLEGHESLARYLVGV